MVLSTIILFGCATQKSGAQNLNCYRSGISIVTESSGWSEQVVRVGDDLVEFNYYASLFVDTVSQITGVPLDSFILFKSESGRLRSDIDLTASVQGKHIFFLSVQKGDYFFIEKVSSFAKENRPDFGTGTIYFLKCSNETADVIFSKVVDYN